MTTIMIIRTRMTTPPAIHMITATIRMATTMTTAADVDPGAPKETSAGAGRRE
jgi:hypothetical protein